MIIESMKRQVRELRAKAEPVGPLHAAWDSIMELEEAIKAMENLDDARKAWRDKATAESQLARLRGYRGRPTPGMKDDMNRWSRLLSESDATLRRVLGGAR